MSLTQDLEVIARTTLCTTIIVYHRRETDLLLCTLNASFVKGIFSDSNNIFLWHKSEDINKKRLFPKFQLILILHS